MEQKGGLYVDLEVLEIEGLSNIYAVDVFRKEFIKAVHENWKNSPPFERYQRKLIQDLAVLSVEKERAIDLPEFEKIKDTNGIYSIRHPETPMNVRILYYISDGGEIILLTAFLEKNIGDYRNSIQRAEKRLSILLSE